MLTVYLGATHPGEARAAFAFGAELANAAWFVQLSLGARSMALLFSWPSAWKVLDAMVAKTMLTPACGLLLHVVVF